MANHELDEISVEFGRNQGRFAYDMATQFGGSTDPTLLDERANSAVRTAYNREYLEPGLPPIDPRAAVIGLIADLTGKSIQELADDRRD